MFMIEDRIKKMVNLEPMTTFKIGGPARYFFEINTEDELIDAYGWAENNKTPVFILGGGSNILVNDKGIDGLVLKMQNQGISLKGDRLECQSGADMAKAVNMAASANLTGLEWAAGIPGTIGGAVRGNAGAFGESISINTEMVEIFNIVERKFSNYSCRECHFGYRDSIFKNMDLLVWKVILRLMKGNADDIKKKMNGNIDYRVLRQPKLPSAGSIFKNIDFDYLKDSNKELAIIAEEEGAVKNDKVPSGWVIDRLGIKGKTIGGAKISLEHANFIVNTGKATSEDVIILISFIKQQSRTKLGIQLSEEIQYFGF
jgi:UDP-N-acetylmuramate dehydrogenase